MVNNLLGISLPEVHPTKPMTKQPGQRNKIKWPKANDWVAWQNLISDLSQLLELALRGSVKNKLNSLGEITFEECMGRFGEVSRKEPTAPRKARREREIEQLVRAEFLQNWRKVEEVIKKAWSTSAPRPNGLPYKLYKNFPQVVKALWKLMKSTWKKEQAPAEWQQAVGVFIPKEQNSHTINQFRNIALLNMEGKIFFSILAKRMSNFIMGNGYIDTSCQKAGIPGFPGCIEHSSVIWDQIQLAKREKSDLHVVWLDLANAYGSVPHKLL